MAQERTREEKDYGFFFFVFSSRLSMTTTTRRRRKKPQRRYFCTFARPKIDFNRRIAAAVVDVPAEDFQDFVTHSVVVGVTNLFDG